MFALPTDAKQLMVLDAGTGRVLNRVDATLPAGDGKRELADVLLGVHDGRAVLCGSHTIFGVDWQRYEPDAAELTRWKEQPWGDDDSSATAIAGRGFLTADGIYVANQQNLSEIDWRRHKIVATYPANGTFDKSGGQGPGNILVTSQNVVVAGADRVDVYTDLALVTARYEAQIKAAPADPDPRVRFAAALFAGGRPADALARLDQAIDLVGGRSAMRPGPGRRQVFTTLLDFTRRLTVPSDQAADPGTVALAGQLFDRAADAADGPAERVAYLLARAQFAQDVTHDYAADVGLAQQVLADPALRPVAVTDERTAAAAAQTAIADAVKLDPAAYRPVEARAKAALADAGHDPDALLAVAEVYPNSTAAGDARRTAVAQFESAGRPGRAIDVLRQRYAAADDPVAKAALLERVAADFLATGPAGVGPAADRLARAGQLTAFDPHLASDLKLPDGTVLRAGAGTYIDAVNALRKVTASADAAALPDLHLPSFGQAVAAYPAAHNGTSFRDASYAYAAAHNGDTRGGPSPDPFRPHPIVLGDVSALVHPLLAFNRPDRLLTWSPAGLAAYDAGQSTPRFRDASVTDAPLAAAWVGGPARMPRTAPATETTAAGRWLVWTPTRVLSRTDDGRDAWAATVSATALPPLAGRGRVGRGGRRRRRPRRPRRARQHAAGRHQRPGRQRPRERRQPPVRHSQQPPGAGPGRGRRWSGPPVAVDGGEQIVSATPAGPAGDVLLVATSAGRLLAVDTTAHPGATTAPSTAPANRILWQARPADRPADAVLANGHFTVAPARRPRRVGDRRL